jgi:hypothetical protein
MTHVSKAKWGNRTKNFVGAGSQRLSSFGLLDPKSVGQSAARFHYDRFLARIAAIHSQQHLPPALPAVPVKQNLPLQHLLGFPQDE